MTDQARTDWAIAEAFTDVQREWETDPGLIADRNKLAGSSASEFVVAVLARAAALPRLDENPELAALMAAVHRILSDSSPIFPEPGIPELAEAYAALGGTREGWKP